MLICDMNI
jgi:hypothetical protein